MSESLIFDLSQPGRATPYLPDCDVPSKPLADLLPGVALRQNPPRLPEVAEIDVMRHFVRLSTLNHHVDKGFYPLGSCTMKYNPKVNEWAAGLPAFSQMHPFAPASISQGNLQLMAELSRDLCEITGMDDITLQPAAGAHGELTGLLLIHAYHLAQGDARKTVVFPDSAHGTNPASVVISGYQPLQIKSREDGMVDLEELHKVLSTDVAAFMLTNPNTLGIFESQIAEIAKMVHSVGAKMYMDGANLNAMLGRTRPGDMGFDVCHLNLHKTFSTPHGGGGPGSGPVVVKADLAPFLPVPRIAHHGDRYIMDYEHPQTIGRVHGFYGNFGILVRAYAYIRALGASGIREVSENAVLNANYLLAELKDYFDYPYPAPPLHEFVLSGERQKREHGVSTLDMAKRLLDYGYHAPTVYFPLIVHEAIMIEPTETESKDTLDAFAAAMIAIAKEAETDPEMLHQAPLTTPVRRLNEVKAARELNLAKL